MAVLSDRRALCVRTARSCQRGPRSRHDKATWSPTRPFSDAEAKGGEWPGVPSSAVPKPVCPSGPGGRAAPRRQRSPLELSRARASGHLESKPRPARPWARPGRPASAPPVPWAPPGLLPRTLASGERESLTGTPTARELEKRSSCRSRPGLGLRRCFGQTPAQGHVRVCSSDSVATTLREMTHTKRHLGVFMAEAVHPSSEQVSPGLPGKRALQKTCHNRSQLAERHFRTGRQWGRSTCLVWRLRWHPGPQRVAPPCWALLPRPPAGGGASGRALTPGPSVLGVGSPRFRRCVYESRGWGERKPPERTAQRPSSGRGSLGPVSTSL